MASVSTFEQALEHGNNLAELNYDLVEFALDQGADLGLWIEDYENNPEKQHLAVLLDIAMKDVKGY